MLPTILSIAMNYLVKQMANTTNYPIIPAAEVQLTADAPILRALEIIDHSRARIALVSDSNGRLIGSLTDGDVRRALLAGNTVESPVCMAMYAQPISMSSDSTRQQLAEAMRTAGI